MGLFDSFRKKNEPEDDYEYESIEQEDYEDESRLVPILKIMSEEFQPEPVESEKEFQSTLVSWLRGRFPENSFDREIPLENGSFADIVIDEDFALELKIPKSRTDFRNLTAQLDEYSEYFSELSAVILVTDESLEKLAMEYSERYGEKSGAYTVILRGSKRKSRKSRPRQNNTKVNSKRKTSKKNGQKYVEIDGKAYPVASTKQNRKNKTTSKSRKYDDDYDDDYDDYDKEQMDKDFGIDPYHFFGVSKDKRKKKSGSDGIIPDPDKFF